MSKSQNLFLIILFYFIHIKQSLQNEITNDKTKCRSDEYYSDLFLRCLGKKTMLKCNGTDIPRDDNLICLKNTTCDNDHPQPVQKDYFGIFFNDEIKCSANKNINPFELEYNYGSITQNCINENLIGCQVLINLCTLYYWNQNENNKECQDLKSSKRTG